MSLHPYIARELARVRQEELHRLAARPSRRLSSRSTKASLRRLRFSSVQVRAPRSATTL